MKDVRISFSKLCVVLSLVSCVIGALLSSITGNEKILLLAIYFSLTATAFAGFHFLRHRDAGLLIFTLMTIYIWIAYPIKLTMAILDPMTLWVSYEIFPPDVVQREISSSFVIIAPGLLALSWGIIVGYKGRRRKGSLHHYRINHIMFGLVIIALLTLRLVNQTVFQIGLPGVKPLSLGIPYLTGLLELLSRPVLFAVINLYFYSIIKLNDPKGLWPALLYIFSNIILGVWVGYKSELILQGFFIAYYLFGLRHDLSTKRSSFLYVICFTIVTGAVVLYPIINQYRSFLLSGQEISQAVESATKRNEKSKYPFIVLFANRINGIGAFYAASKLGESREFPVSSLFDSSVMDLIKEKLYGRDKDEAVTAFGTTLFSVLYLIGGLWLLYIGCLMFGWLIIGVSSILRERLYKSSIIFDAYLPFYSVWCVKLLSSGGEVALFLKELILVVAVLYLIERYCFRISNTASILRQSNLQFHAV